MWTMFQFLLGATFLGCAAALPHSGRIVGGQDAVITDYPWQVSLQSSGNHFCGGSLVDANHVLTAAHCFKQTPVNVIMGIDVLSETNSEGSQSRLALAFTRDPEYNSVTITHDYAMILLTTPVQITSYVSTIPLATSDQTTYTDGEMLVTSGWGYTTTSGLFTTVSDVLQYGNVPYVKNCESYWPGSGSIYKICAGGSGTSSCMGDSGGPLIKPTADGTYELVGAVSYGNGDCDVNIPAVYAAVYPAKEWIESLMTAA